MEINTFGYDYEVMISSNFLFASPFKSGINSSRIDKIAQAMSVEGWNGKPVQVVECENSYGFLVTDGHKRVCAAARNGESVPIAVIQKDWNGEKHKGQYWCEV